MRVYQLDGSAKEDSSCTSSKNSFCEDICKKFTNLPVFWNPAEIPKFGFVGQWRILINIYVFIHFDICFQMKIGVLDFCQLRFLFLLKQGNTLISSERLHNLPYFFIRARIWKFVQKKNQLIIFKGVYIGHLNFTLVELQFFIDILRITNLS